MLQVTPVIAIPPLLRASFYLQSYSWLKYNPANPGNLPTNCRSFGNAGEVDRKIVSSRFKLLSYGPILPSKTEA